MEQVFTDFLDPELFKANIRQGKINHFKCYLPLPNGKERIELGDFILDGKEDPRGQDILTCFDKDDLDDAVEALEHDAPSSTDKDFWEAYDLCRICPYNLIWELLSPEVAIHLFDHRNQQRKLWEETYDAKI